VGRGCLISRCFCPFKHESDDDCSSNDGDDEDVKDADRTVAVTTQAILTLHVVRRGDNLLDDLLRRFACRQRARVFTFACLAFDMGEADTEIRDVPVTFANCRHFRRDVLRFTRIGDKGVVDLEGFQEIQGYAKLLL